VVRLVPAILLLAALPAHAKPADEDEARVVAKAQEALRGGDPARAATLLEPLAWKLRDDADYRMTSAFAHLGTGDFEASERDVRWLESNRGTLPEVHALRGRLELALAEQARLYGPKGEIAWHAKKAAAALSKVPAGDPPRPIVLELRAEALAESGAEDESIAAYRALIAADPGRMASFTSAARSAAAAARWDEVSGLFALAGATNETGWAVLRGAIAGGEDSKLLPLIAALRENETRPERRAALEAYRALVAARAGEAPCDLAVEPDEGFDDADSAAISAARVRSLVRRSAAAGWTLPKTEEASCGVVPPVLVTNAEPVYPDDLRRQRVSGSAILVALVAKDGTVRVENVVRAADPAFARAAAAAIAKRRYKPATIDGRPVAIAFVIKVDFFIR
jgi:TonB family protein